MLKSPLKSDVVVLMALSPYWSKESCYSIPILPNDLLCLSFPLRICLPSSSPQFLHFLCRETGMALEMFAGAFLSASLQVLFDRLASSEVWSFIGGQKVSEELLLELGMKLLVVDKVLDHAEVKQFTDERVKRWLVRVKNAVYDAEHLLDEITTEALRRKMEAADSQTGPTHLLNSFSTWFMAPLADHQSMEFRVKKIIGKLEVLAQAIDVLALKGDGKKLPQRLPSISLVDEFCVYGRDGIKEDMIKRLLSDTTSRNKIDVISIVGMGGAGKTTLALSLNAKDCL